jgi:septal ring factor EnvC (AmiA/AmiB activator)
MSHNHDDYDSPDESEGTDPIIRELRTEIIRLEAQLDQLTASIRERAEEAAVLQAQLVELEMRVERLEARRRRDERLLVLAWAFVVASLAMSVYTYLTT